MATPPNTRAAATAIRIVNGSPSTATPSATAISGLMYA
jgi:hypothetical protein